MSDYKIMTMVTGSFALSIKKAPKRTFIWTDSVLLKRLIPQLSLKFFHIYRLKFRPMQPIIHFRDLCVTMFLSFSVHFYHNQIKCL